MVLLKFFTTSDALPKNMSFDNLIIIRNKIERISEYLSMGAY